MLTLFKILIWILWGYQLGLLVWIFLIRKPINSKKRTLKPIINMYSKNFKRKGTGEIISPADYNKLPNRQQHDYQDTEDPVTHKISGDRETGLLLTDIETGEETESKEGTPAVKTELSADVSTAVEKVKADN